MDTVIKEKVEQWFAAHREEIIRQLMALVAIPSQTHYNEDGYPYGRACHDVMDAYQAMAEAMGMKTQRFDDHVVTAALEEDPARKTVGFWAHLDVVPPGNGWIFSPFEPVYREGYVIGRGADDNKSAAVGVLYLMRCLQELGVPLQSNLKAFAGCDEECGSRGVAEYVKHHPCPDFSLVPDCGFPVCYGEKGIINVTFRALKPFAAPLQALEGGVVSNVIPDTARAVLPAHVLPLEKAKALPGDVTAVQQGNLVEVVAHGASGHAGFPVGSNNAVRTLLRALTEWVGAEDLPALTFLQAVNQDHFGTALGIDMEDEESGRLTCCGTVLRLEGGVPSLTANIRYCVTADGERIRRQLLRVAGANGFELSDFSDSPPNFFPREQPMVAALTGVYNQITGDDKQPFVMSGGTYARNIPNAVGYGIGGMPHARCPLIPQGHGSAHGPDETLHIDSYLQALTILTMGVIEADRCLNME